MADASSEDEYKQKEINKIKRKKKLRAFNPGDSEASDFDDEFEDNFAEGIENVYNKAKESAKTTDIFQKEDEFPIEPLHMREELETGKINKEGFYERDREKEAEITDPWLKSLEKAGENAEEVKLNSLEMNIEAANDPNSHLAEEEQVDQTALKQEVLQYLQKNENASGALKRLRPQSRELRPSFKKNVRKRQKIDEENKGESKGDGQEDAAKQQQHDFEKLNAACAKLLSSGYTDVYTIKRRALELEVEDEVEEQELLKKAKEEQNEGGEQQAQEGEISTSAPRVTTAVSNSDLNDLDDLQPGR